MQANNECMEEPVYELIDGKEYMMTPPSLNHSRVANNLGGILRSYLRGKRCMVFGEVEVHLDDDNYYVPDLIVLCDRDKIKNNQAIWGAPDLVIEILSRSTSTRDRREKKKAYERSGVREYWLVNPDDRSIEVYHLSDGAFELDDVYYHYTDEEWSWVKDRDKKELCKKLTLKVSLYNDFEISLAEVFEDLV